MLRKMIKHEWKDTCKVGLLMLFLLVLVTFLGWLAFRSPMWSSLASDVEVESTLVGGLADIMSFFTLMIYVFMLVGVTYGMVIYLAVRFYKTMYTDQGYLIHTLPVTKYQILGSKILVGGIWYMLITIGILLSVVLLILSLVSALMPEGYTLARAFAEIGIDMSEFWALMKEELGFDLTMWIVYMIVAIFVSPFSALTIIYGAITLGQLFTKHRVLMAIVFYIGIMVVEMLISSVIQGVSSMANFTSMMVSDTLTGYGDYMGTTLLSALLINVVLAVGLYFASHRILEKKLNME